MLARETKNYFRKNNYKLREHSILYKVLTVNFEGNKKLKIMNFVKRCQIGNGHGQVLVGELEMESIFYYQIRNISQDVDVVNQVSTGTYHRMVRGKNILDLKLERKRRFKIETVYTDASELGNKTVELENF